MGFLIECEGGDKDFKKEGPAGSKGECLKRKGGGSGGGAGTPYEL